MVTVEWSGTAIIAIYVLPSIYMYRSIEASYRPLSPLLYMHSNGMRGRGILLLLMSKTLKFRQVWRVRVYVLITWQDLIFSERSCLFSFAICCLDICLSGILLPFSLYDEIHILAL